VGPLSKGTGSQIARRTMLRNLCLGIIATSLVACSPAGRTTYVVRLNLEQIAADTAARESSPGFASLGG
jgi:hypothetical protein